MWPVDSDDFHFFPFSILFSCCSNCNFNNKYFLKYLFLLSVIKTFQYANAFLLRVGPTGSQESTLTLFLKTYCSQLWYSNIIDVQRQNLENCYFELHFRRKLDILDDSGKNIQRRKKIQRNLSSSTKKMAFMTFIAIF